MEPLLPVKRDGFLFGGDHILYNPNQCNPKTDPNATVSNNTHSFYVTKQTNEIQMLDLVAHARLCKQVNKYLILEHGRKQCMVYWSTWT